MSLPIARGKRREGGVAFALKQEKPDANGEHCSFVVWKHGSLRGSQLTSYSKFPIELVNLSLFLTKLTSCYHHLDCFVEGSWRCERRNLRLAGKNRSSHLKTKLFSTPFTKTHHGFDDARVCIQWPVRVD